MFPLLHWLSARHWRQHPIRAALTLIGVSLGVAVTLAVNLIGTEIQASHRRSLEYIAGKAELTVSAGETGMSREVTDRIAAVDGVAHVDPLLEKVLIEPGKGPVVLLGVDFLGDDALRQVEAGEGDEEILEDPIAFLNSKESCVVPYSFARPRNLKKGDSFELMTALGRKRFVIRGLLKDKGPAQTFGGDVVVMYLDAAQVALELDDTITRVDLAAQPGLDPAILKERLKKELGAEFDVDYPQARGARLEEMMTGLNQALSMMAALAVWVGVLLAYNAVEISVRQRQRELAVLRALGASRRTVISLVLLEALFLGVGATSLGIAFGYGMAHAGLSSTASTVSEVYELIRVDDVKLDAFSLTAALIVGLLVPLIGALRPARWGCASSTGHRSDEASRRRRRSAGRAARALPGLELRRSRARAFLQSPAQVNPNVGQAGFALVLFGALFFAPALISMLARATHRVFGSRMSAEATVAVDHVIRDRRRAALNVASLVAGVTTVITIATYIHSLTVTYMGWMDNALPAHLYITSGHTFGMNQNTPLDPKIGELFTALPEVDGIFHVRMQDVDFRGKPIKVLSIECDEYHKRAKPVVLDGDTGEPGIFADGRRVLLSENIARREKLKPGDEFELWTPSGPQRLIVQAVVMDFTSDQGLIVMDRAAFVRLFRDPLVDTFELFLKDPSKTASVQQQIRQRYGEEYDLFILTSTDFKAEGMRIIDDFFKLLDLLQFVTLLIAVLGVATTLIAAVLDRTQEVGVMRAVGSTPGQIVRIVLTEAGFIGGFSALLGGVLGCFTGYLFLKSVVLATVGWNFPWQVPWTVLPTVVVAVTAAGVLAGIYPALWSARQPTLDAMRTE